MIQLYILSVAYSVLFSRLEKSVSDELYKDDNNESFDLAALNIHR